MQNIVTIINQWVWDVVGRWAERGTTEMTKGHKEILEVMDISTILAL